MSKLYTVQLTTEELRLIRKALPMITDREVEEETDPDERVGEAADDLNERLHHILRPGRAQ